MVVSSLFVRARPCLSYRSKQAVMFSYCLLKEGARGQNRDRSVSWLCEVSTVAGDQNRAASRGGGQVNLIVRVTETEHGIHRLDTDSQSLYLANDCSHGIAVRCLLGSSGHGLILSQDDIVPPHRRVDDCAAGAVDPGCRHQNVAVQDNPHVSRWRRSRRESSISEIASVMISF